MGKTRLTICFLGEAKKEDIFTVRWAKYFANKGHNVYLISYGLPERKNTGNIKVYILKKKFPKINSWPFNAIFNLPFALAQVKKIIREIKPDIIHAQCITNYGTLASLIGFHPFVVTAYGSDILINPKKFLPLKWSTKYALKKADFITCDAQHMKGAMVKLGADESKIKIINFGIDTKKFSPKEKKKELLEKLGIKENEKIIISLRRLEPIYDIETLIKAAQIVLEEFQATKFLIAGKGIEEEKLKEMAQSLNIVNNILFLGWIDNQKLPDYINISDIYVSTSLSDGGIASSTAEAMACDSGENKEWIEDGMNGFLIPIKSPEILAKRIISLLKNTNRSVLIGQNTRMTIERRNDYYIEMEKIEGIYYQLSNERYE